MTKRINIPLAALLMLSIVVFVVYQLGFNFAKTNQQNILIDALPKSGSTYIRTALSQGLDYKNLSILPSKSINSRTFTSIPQFYATGQQLGVQHLRAPIDMNRNHLGPPIMDMEELAKFTDRKIIHVRDPRPALLSFVHYINKHQEDAQVNPPRPEGYYQLSFHDQIDWCIDNLLPLMVDWIENWIKYKDIEDKKLYGFKIMITTYDELVADQDALFKKILAFYNIPESKFKSPNLQKEIVVNFRKGDDSEWRNVFTPEQIQRANAKVPDSLLQRFNWIR